METAHHMLLYGCERPGTDDPVWNCGDMAVRDPQKRTGPVCRGANKVGQVRSLETAMGFIPHGLLNVI